jgi:glutathionylspermidine synthase
MMFEYFKWDPQVGDACTIGAFAVVLPPGTWRELAAAAEALAAETAAAEAELLDRPALAGELGLPPEIRRRLARARTAPSPAAARLIRFDFHYTPDGWMISEANADVPGGFNEADGLPPCVMDLQPGLRACGEPGRRLAEAVAAGCDPAAGVIALVHATAYTDDRQVMLQLARHLEAVGGTPELAAPDHVRRSGRGGALELHCGADRRPVAAAIRFFPAEWLVHLDRRDDWSFWFSGSPVGLCNPGSALLPQSKRLPLVWDRLRTPMPAWRRYLPETRDPRAIGRDREAWVVKPAFGRVGEDIGMAGVTPDRAWRALWRQAGFRPRAWIAQRRFHTMPVEVAGEPWHVCLGVYTINGRAAGIYGRADRSPLITGTACDIAVLTEPASSTGQEPLP